jgi:hypothetical protein
VAEPDTGADGADDGEEEEEEEEDATWSALLGSPPVARSPAIWKTGCEVRDAASLGLSASSAP